MIKIKHFCENISNYSGDIAQILEDCESIQNSNESAYTKEQAKITAYNQILELVSEVV